jgi:hypothetical protein
MPWKSDVLHPEGAHFFAFGVGAVAASVDDDVNASFSEGLETLMGWLSSAEKLGSNFSEIADTFYFAFFTEVSQKRGACWRRLGRAPGNGHPEQKGQCANAAGCLLHRNKKLLIPRGIRRGQLVQPS